MDLTNYHNPISRYAEDTPMKQPVGKQSQNRCISELQPNLPLLSSQQCHNDLRRSFDHLDLRHEKFGNYNKLNNELYEFEMESDSEQQYDDIAEDNFYTQMKASVEDVKSRSAPLLKVKNSNLDLKCDSIPTVVEQLQNETMNEGGARKSEERIIGNESCFTLRKAKSVNFVTSNLCRNFGEEIEPKPSKFNQVKLIPYVSTCTNSYHQIYCLYVSF